MPHNELKTKSNRKRKLQGKRVVVSSQFLERGLDLFEKTFRKLFPRFAWVSYVLWMEETWVSHLLRFVYCNYADVN